MAPRLLLLLPLARLAPGLRRQPTGPVLERRESGDGELDPSLLLERLQRDDLEAASLAFLHEVPSKANKDWFIRTGQVENGFEKAIMSEERNFCHNCSFHKYLVHIPKTAGTSFTLDAFYSAPHGTLETCFSWFKGLNDGLAHTLLLVREPRSHVLSMYGHCRGSRWMPSEDRALVPDTFEDFVQNWTARASQNSIGGNFSDVGGDITFAPITYTKLPFKCYHPVNLQTWRMLCKTPYNYDQDPKHLNVSAAIANMRTAWFVGVKEAYHESICLYRWQTNSSMPPGCNCESPGAWGAFRMARIIHKDADTNLTLEAQSNSVLRQVDALTSLDRQLYAATVQRFVSDVREAEERWGKKILCKDTLETLRSLTQTRL